MMYDTEVKSAPVSKNTTKRLLSSIIDPKVGHAVFVKDDWVGEYARSVNPADWKIQEFDPLKSEYPFILGFEAAGTVVQLGEGVSSLAVGDKV